MNHPSTSLWRSFVIAWILVIFFSSTSLASQWCESGFAYVSAVLFRRLHPHSSSYDLVHLLADKGLHVTMFCVLAILLWHAFPTIQHKVPTILVCGAIVGSCSEFLQRFFPGRDPAIRDVLINIAGTALGIGLWALLRLSVERRSFEREHSAVT
ncbi:MAG: VanZ family protein [Acidobacteriaceae bacterium]|nr:VanZ family protein [Acidobacteriaceae bacterium]